MVAEQTAGRSNGDPVFSSRYGRAYTRFGIYRVVERCAAAVPELSGKTTTPHVLRHTAACSLVRAGVDLNTIRAWLGHVSLETTNIYAEIDLEMKGAGDGTLRCGRGGTDAAVEGGSRGDGVPPVTLSAERNVAESPASPLRDKGIPGHRNIPRTATCHQSPHRGLDGETPLDRWAATGADVRYPNPGLDFDDLFLFEVKRRVMKDRTVSLNGCLYEVDALLVGQTVVLRYDPAAPPNRPLQVVHDGKPAGQATVLDAYANTAVPARPSLLADPDRRPRPRTAAIPHRPAQTQGQRLMYTRHFAFARLPFENDLHTDELFQSSAHREAQVRLKHLIELRGIGLLTGEVGSGKTTVCRYVTAGLHPGLHRVYYVSLTTGNVLDMYKSIAWELGLPTERSRATAYRAIRNEITRLVTEAKQLPVLIVDEAQHLRNDVLEDLRLLTNFNMDADRRLCMLLVGLTELRRRLAMAVHESLSQRLVVRHHIGSLERNELDDYLTHRLRLAGCELPLFEPPAVEALYQSSRGLPRPINRTAHYALSAAALAKARTVDAEHMQHALEELRL